MPVELPAKFVEKLYQMIQEEDPSIISWSADGSYFRIFDRTRFQEECLPKYYRHQKLTSFQRQLNFYEFQLVPSNFTLIDADDDPFRNKHATLRYYHAHFRRNFPENLRLVRRNQPRKVSNRTRSYSAENTSTLLPSMHMNSPQLRSYSGMDVEGLSTSVMLNGQELQPRVEGQGQAQNRFNRSFSMSYAERLSYVDPYAYLRARNAKNYSLYNEWSAPDEFAGTSESPSGYSSSYSTFPSWTSPPTLEMPNFSRMQPPEPDFESNFPPIFKKEQPVEQRQFGEPECEFYTLPCADSLSVPSKVSMRDNYQSEAERELLVELLNESERLF